MSGLSPPDPRAVLQDAPMSPYQWVAVAVTVALCALDGYDVLAVTLAAPGLSHAWGLTKVELGLVFSLGLFGMAAGSLAVAPMADIAGRRPVVLFNLVLMTLGMWGCARSADLAHLAGWRVLTGLGIGATIAVINPLAAEYANARRRDLAISLMAVGFPIGGVTGGWAAAIVLREHDWRAVFLMGSVAGAALIPAVLAALPESVSFLIARPRARALDKVNLFLRRSGHPQVTALPAPPERRAARLSEIFRGAQLRPTLQITAIYFLFVMSVYFVLSWIPQMVADSGFAPSAAASVSAAVNLSGVASGAFLGWAAGRAPLKGLVLVALVGMALATAAFGFAGGDLTLLRLSAAGVGVFLYAGMVGLYALIARTFAAQQRATGTGFVIGVGRVGSALAPAAAGLLFSLGLGRGAVSVAMGAMAMLSAVLLLGFRFAGADDAARSAPLAPPARP